MLSPCYLHQDLCLFVSKSPEAVKSVSDDAKQGDLGAGNTMKEYTLLLYIYYPYCYNTKMGENL